MTALDDLTSLDISVGDDDSQYGLHLGVDDEPFWRVEIRPQGGILFGSGMAPPTASGKGFVNHGAVAGTARPVGPVSVEWYGAVQPTNAIVGDTWIDTT